MTEGHTNTYSGAQTLFFDSLDRVPPLLLEYNYLAILVDDVDRLIDGLL